VPQTGFGSAVKQTERALENVFKRKIKYVNLEINTLLQTKSQIVLQREPVGFK
jgi:hypothetical protein